MIKNDYININILILQYRYNNLVFINNWNVIHNMIYTDFVVFKTNSGVKESVQCAVECFLDLTDLIWWRLCKSISVDV